MLRLWQCKGCKAGWNEVTSKLDVAEFRTRNLCCRMCVQKRQASDDTGVAESFVFTEARKIWMLSWHVLWLMSLSPSFPCPSVRNLSFPAANHDASCPPLQAMVAPSQLEHGQDSSCPPVLSDTRPYWPRKHDVQGTFKAKSLHETTTWISRDLEIISKTRWSEPELGKLLRWPCRDSSGFLNLHGNRTIFSASDLVAYEASIYCICKQKHRFCWLPSVSYHLEPHNLKNIWSVNRDDELSKVWKWNCLSVGATSQDLGCLVKWRVPWVDELDFEELALNMGKSLCKRNRDWFLLLRVNP